MRSSVMLVVKVMQEETLNLQKQEPQREPVPRPFCTFTQNRGAEIKTWSRHFSKASNASSGPWPTSVHTGIGGDAIIPIAFYHLHLLPASLVMCAEPGGLWSLDLESQLVLLGPDHHSSPSPQYICLPCDSGKLIQLTH